MYPHERSLVKRMAERPFALLGINSDKDLDKLKEAMTKEEITWRSWRNGGSTSGPTSTKWNVRGWPTMYVIDAQGVIRHKWIGSPGGETIDKVIDGLVKEAETRSATK